MEETEFSDLMTKTEGEIKFYSYDPTKFSDTGKALTKSMPVFYNPVQELNRSISLILFKTFYEKYKEEEKEKQRIIQEKDPNLELEPEKVFYICDVMAASGIRSLRLHKFLPKEIKIISNDLNPLALKLINANAEINGISIENSFLMLNLEANFMFNELRNRKIAPQIIDIDPFGSPNIFIENALNAISKNGLLAITATDTAVFFGVRKQACKKKYNTKSLHSTFLKEVGLRILLYFVATRAHPLNKGIVPLMSLSFDHYIRIFMKIQKGREVVNQNIAKFGYILWCPHCDWRKSISMNLHEFSNTCPICQKRIDYGGPLWVGKLHDEEFTKDAKKIFEHTTKMQIPSKKKIEKVLTLVENEDKYPIGYYEIHKFCDNLNLPNPSRKDLIEAIEVAGFQAQETHINPRAIKSTITGEKLKEILIKLSQRYIN